MTSQTTIPALDPLPPVVEAVRAAGVEMTAEREAVVCVVVEGPVGHRQLDLLGRSRGGMAPTVSEESGDVTRYWYRCEHYEVAAWDMGHGVRVELALDRAPEGLAACPWWLLAMLHRRMRPSTPKPKPPADPRDLCESPIETALYDMLAPNARPDVAVTPQHWHGDYRIDFLVTGPNGRRIAVECDGFDFHERTPEQAARDRRRDRDLQLAGFMVLRYTGAEIHRDAVACAIEILGAARASRG